MNGICHVEIPCTDLKNMKDFYGNVFGWETNFIPQMDYAMFKTPDGVSGGFSKDLKVTDRPGVLLYIEVNDIDAAFKKIQQNGGQEIKNKTLISPEIGYFGIFSDSEGNVIGLWAKQ